MNNYYESAAFLINSDKYAYYPDAFKLRLNFVMQSESSLIGIRRVPAYLTDIGVRKFSDPKFYFEQIIKKFHPKLNYEFGKLNFPLDSLGINQLSLGLDSTVLLTGDYEAAYKVVNQRYDEILTCNNDRLLVLTGVLMGALGDEKSIPLFERAEKISLNPYVHFMSIHRKNALNVKRFSLNTIAFDEMNELDFKIESYIQYERVPQSEKLILKASVANLRALNYLKIRNEEEAYLEILKAFNLSKSGIKSGLTRREGLRYHAQILANLAQMLVLKKNYLAAINVLEESVEFCNKYEQDSLSESLSLLAYAHYLDQNFENAIRFAGPAIKKIITEGSISRLEVITNILIASHWQLGNRGAAEYILQEFEQDPFHLGAE